MLIQKPGLKCFIACYCLMLLMMLTGCNTTGSSHPGSWQSKETLLFWPAPPQTPKIQFLRNVYSPEDIGIKKSWARKALDAFFGTEELPDLILRPHNIYVIQSGIYVTDPGDHVVHIFDSTAKNYFKIKEAGAEELQSPIGIAVDNSGNIYITDSILKKIFVFDKKGHFLHELGQTRGILRPTGIAIYEDKIYVIDTLAHNVLVFNKEDKFLFQFGNRGYQKGEFNYPTNIFIDKKGIIYITDSMNFRVQVFDREGRFLFYFGKPGDGSGDLSKPKGIAVDSDGHIYVADAYFDNVQIFDREGRLLLVFGNTGVENGQMILPAGIFIDENDRIYIADSYNHRIQMFQYLKEKQ